MHRSRYTLTPEVLVYAYRQGAFPMGEADTDEVHWYSPDPRAIIPLEPAEATDPLAGHSKGQAFHVPHGLKRTLKKIADGMLPIVVTRDRAFERVIRACAAPRRYESGVWITAEIVHAYIALHRAGMAHSVEAWSGDKLIGGLYGVAIGGAFFGESMFSRATDASKVCLVHLVEHVRRRGYTLLDSQVANEHMMQFGVVEIPRAEYLDRLARAIDQPVTWA